MTTIVYKDYAELSIQTAQHVAAVVAEKPDALLCFPAGETPLGTFAELIQMQKRGQVNFSTCKIVGLDEWVRLGVMKNENCYSFLKLHLFDRVNAPQKNICFFNGEAADLEHECVRTDEFIRANGGIDLMLLGVGMNGHLGLNEPGTPIDTYSHVVELDETTRSVGQKYFSARANLTKGITLGLRHVMETKRVIAQLSGVKKSQVVKQVFETEVTTNYPASLIKKHPNALLLLDHEASKLTSPAHAGRSQE